MGWGGKKRTVAAPQPNPDGAPDPDVMSKSRMKRIETLAAEEEPIAPVAGDQVAWHQFRSRRGWTDETVAIVLYEFIQSQALFKELVTFAKGRK